MNNHSIAQPMISIPIPESARQTAKEFAQEHTNLDKVKQVYLNTLAVYVVNTYLQMLDIPTDLQASYSWSYMGRLCADVADLHISKIGHLECRPMRNGLETCNIPPEVWANRIGYVIVQLDKTCKEGKILGFLPTVTSSTLNINELQPLIALLEHLHSLQITNLRQWLNGIYATKWRDINELSDQNSPVLAFRSNRLRGVSLDNPVQIKQAIQQLYTTHRNNFSIPELKITDKSQFPDILVQMLQTSNDEETRWKVAEMLWTIAPHHPIIKTRRITDLGLQIAGHSVALMVAILPKPNREIAVLLRLYPLNNQPYLPAGIQLAGLYENGEAFLEVQARNQDDYIQLKFSTEFGEKFSVRVRFNDANIIENFVV
jgi:hypothetical protein